MKNNSKVLFILALPALHAIGHSSSSVEFSDHNKECDWIFRNVGFQAARAIPFKQRWLLRAIVNKLVDANSSPHPSIKHAKIYCSRECHGGDVKN
jgi:hypothetical protein